MPLTTRVRTGAVGLDALRAISLLPDGALAAGSRGTVVRRTAAGWFPHAAGLEEDFEGVAAFGPASAWVVGARGVAYRLEDAGWRAIDTGTDRTLRAIAGRAVDDVVAVGDGGTILRYRDGWRPRPGPAGITLRAAALVGTATWVVGDRGTVIRLDGDVQEMIDLATSCTLRAVFAQRGTIWIVGSDGTNAAVWRIGTGAARQWGACP